MATDLDVRFQTALANDFPAFVTNPTRALERSHAVEDRLADLRGPTRFAETRDDGRRAGLPVLGKAPDFTGTQRWFNTPAGAPLRPEPAARPGRAGRLLDLHLHQLHPHAALRARLGSSATGGAG